MTPEFHVTTPGAQSSYRSLARAILEARRHRVPVLCGGHSVTWRAAREGRGARIYAWLAGGAV